MIKFGLIGAGHLGKIHIKLLQALSNEIDIELLGFYDINKEVCKEVAEKFNIKAYNSFDEMLKEVDAIDIVCPTTSHFDYAEKALFAGKHIFLEKPACSSTQEVEELLAINKSANVKVQVGHVERFNPAYLAIQDRIINSKYFSISRLAPFNLRGTDVSVIMDLMIHDLDILLHQKSENNITNIEASGVSTLTNLIDHANVSISFDDGTVAHLEASRVADVAERKITIFDEVENFYTLDFLNKKAHFSKKENEIGFKTIELATPAVNAIKMELELFAQSIKEDLPEIVSLSQARNVIETAIQIEELIYEQQSQKSSVIG